METPGPRLRLIRAANVTLRADPAMEELYRARFEGREPKVDTEDHLVTLRYPRFAVGHRLPYRSTVTLRGTVPWRIECRGMLRRLRGDLGLGLIEALDVHDGASGVSLHLPAPAGNVPIQLFSAAVDVNFLRPAGAAIRVSVHSGATDTSLDEQHFKAVGGRLNWQTPDFDEATDRFDVVLLRGVRNLTVATYAARPSAGARTGRALATVVFTHIVLSTEVARNAGDQRWAELLDRHDAAAARLSAGMGGRLVKTTGDGVLALFEEPTQAIGFVRAFGEEVRTLGLSIRAGLHTGEVEYRAEDVRGIGVHIASRVMGYAGPGEILVSRTVRDLITGSEVSLEDRGVHPLRGIGQDWQLFAVS
jgi:class 3 adenylate cyclase